MILSTELPIAEATGALCIELPQGLIGLKHLCFFEVEPVEGSWPFITFRSLGEDRLNFLVIEPAHAVPGYHIELSDEDVDALDLQEAGDALIFNIVTVHSATPQYATANLIGPIVVNRRTLKGKQVILANADQYSTHYALVDEREVEVAA